MSAARPNEKRRIGRSKQPMPKRVRAAPSPPANWHNDQVACAGGLTELTIEQKVALELLLSPVQTELQRLRTELAAVKKRLQKHEALSPGIDIDLGCDALTEQDAAARRKLTQTANHLLTLETTRDMHDYVMQLPIAEAAYYDAWRRQYFLKCFRQQRDYFNLACDLRKELERCAIIR
jgi:hypothetical protein